MDTARRTPLWLWINLLSLDAPLVALAWQDLLARCYPAVLLPQGRFVLGLTVWAIYVADRLLDTRRPLADPRDAEHQAPRHNFYRRHRLPMAILLAAILIADLSVAIRWIQPGVVAAGAMVFLATGSYLFVFALRGNPQVVWKKSAAAILFAAGVFVIEFARLPQPLRTLFWPAVAFALLCKGNLVMIEHWERNWNTAIVWISLLLFALLCLVAGRSAWYLAIALSAVGLAALGFNSARLTPDARRVLADVVLMVPFLIR